MGLSLLANQSPARAEPRVALVIGNADYGSEMGRLPNPARDAALMEESLSAAGFEVIAITNADQKAMKRAISDFGKRLTAAGPDVTALFYYSGHGLQVAGENYLIPSQAQITAEADVDLEAVSADTILKQMQFASARVNIIILDACRNNPLPRGFRSAQMGLARMEAPRGSFVAYSTAPGEVATDGSGQNSPYTAALAAAITKPGLSIEEAFRTVRGSVLTETGNTQTPWESSSLTAPFFFTPASQNPSVPVAAVAAAPQDPHEETFWNSIKDSENPADFEAYLEQYPKGSFVRLARNRLALLSTTPAARSEPPPVEAPAEPDAGVAAEEEPPQAAITTDVPGDPEAAADLCWDDGVEPEKRLVACRTALGKDGLDDIAKADFTGEIGQAHNDLTEYREAMDAYRTAMKLDPTAPAYPAGLGLALSMSGKYPEAIDAYTKALDLDPNNVWNLYNRGFAHLNSGDAAKAGADLDQALALDENFELLAARGFVALAEGKDQLATDFTSRAIAYDPDGYNVQSIAVLYLAERDQDAIAMIERMVGDGQGYGYGEIWHGLLLSRQEKTEAAQTLLTQALESHREDWPGMLMRWMLGKYDDATLLSKAREGSRQDVRNQLCEAHFYLGERSYRAGQKAEAQTHFTAALSSKVYGYSEYQAAGAYLRRLTAGD